MIRTLVLLLACVATVVLADGVAGAQEPFAPETLSASNLDRQQREEIRTFVSTVVEGLSSDDAVTVMNARRAAQRELTRDEVRVPFRLEFASAAAGKLADLAKAESDLTAINAIYVLGDVAAGQTVIPLIDALKDSRESVRYAAVVALEKTFTAENADVPRSDVDLIRRELAQQLEVESSSAVVVAYVRTLSAAADATRSPVPQMRATAISLLGGAFADRIAEATNPPEQPAKPAMIDAMLLAGQTIRGQLTRPELTLPQAELRAASRLGGRLLAYVRARIEAGNVGEADSPDAVRTERQNLEDLARLGEQIATFAGDDLGTKIGALGLPELIAQDEAAADDEFAQKVMELIGPDGELTAPPFDHPDDEFVK